MERLGKERDKALDAVKGFAILIVMLGHCIILNGLNDPYIYDAIAAVQMPLFMVVSGFLAGRTPLSPNKKPDGKEELRRFGKRTVSYLTPFFAWMLLTHITDPVGELRLQLFALDRGLWFLMTLWIVTLVMTLASYAADFCAYHLRGTLFKKGVLRFAVFCLIVGACYLGFVIQARNGNLFLSPSLTVKYLPFYLAGYLWTLYVIPFAAQARRSASEKRPRHAAFLQRTDAIARLIWLLAGAAFVYLVDAFDMVTVSDTGGLLIQMSASFLGSFFCFYGIYHYARGRLWRLLSFIGQYTLEIYVLHFRFARLLGISGKNLRLYSPEAVCWVVAAFVVMSVLTALCIFVIKKIWILDFLLFGKRKKASP